MPQMSIEEILERRKYLVDGLQSVSKAINERYASKKLSKRVSASLVRAVLNGTRLDKHGIFDTFKSMTDAEKLARAEFVEKLAKGE